MTIYDQILLSSARSGTLVRTFGGKVPPWTIVTPSVSEGVSAISPLLAALLATITSVSLLGTTRHKLALLEGGGDGGGDGSSGESAEGATVSSSEATPGSNFSKTEAAVADTSATAGSYVKETGGELYSAKMCTGKEDISVETNPTSFSATMDTSVSQSMISDADSSPTMCTPSMPSATPTATMSANNLASGNKDPSGSALKTLADTTQKGLDATANYIDYARDATPADKALGEGLGNLSRGYSYYKAYQKTDNVSDFAVEVGKDEATGLAASVVGRVVAVATKSPILGAASSVAASVAFDYVGDAVAAVEQRAIKVLGPIIDQIDQEIYKLYGVSQYR